MTMDGWIQLGLTVCTGIGGVVTAGIAWSAKVLKERFEHAEAETAKAIAELKDDNKLLHKAKDECEQKHTATAISLAEARAEAKAALEQLQNCHMEECPFKPAPGKKTQRIKLRPAA